MDKIKEDAGTTLQVRLAKYGLHPDALNGDTLRVTSRSKVRLSATGSGIPPARWLHAPGIAELKSWIGAPQSVVSNNRAAFSGRRASKLPPVSMLKTLPNIHGKQRQALGDPRYLPPPLGQMKQHGPAIRDAIRQYLFGDASELKALEPILELHINLHYPFWLFNQVIVEREAVLEFGPGMNSIVVDTLVIKQGGTIRCEGGLKIDCRRIARS